MSERDVTARDGRTLRIAEGGDPGGVPVLMLHGAPASRRLDPADVARAAERGIRLISYDRPGYGGSTRHEGRNVAACATDVRAVADTLGIRRLAVWGISGGGPHAAACAALLGDLVPAVAVLASPAPYGAPRLNWLDGMGEDNVAEFSAVLQGPAAGRALLEQARPGLIAADPGAMAEAMRTLLAPVDAAVLTGELASQLLAAMQLGLAPGVDGWLDDDLAYVGDWGFGLTQIRTPVLLVHGREDRFVPFAHGQWLATAIPGVEARLLDGEGHLSLLSNRIPEVEDWLLQRVG